MSRRLSFPRDLSLSPIFTLSDGLLVKIISNLCPDDIYACRLTCRQLNDLIVNSQLIQYIIRTALSGVFDLLDPGLSPPASERLDALQRWETAWTEMDLREPIARIDAPVPSKGVPPVEFSFGRYFVVIREGYGRSAGYSFLDMHAGFTAHADAAQWTTIEVKIPNVLVFAFASELDLAVAISCVPPFSSVFFFKSARRLGHPGFQTDKEQRSRYPLCGLAQEVHTRWHPDQRLNSPSLAHLPTTNQTQKSSGITSCIGSEHHRLHALTMGLCVRSI